MSKPLRAVELPSMRGGINRRADASPDQCAEALDVIAEGDGVGRRDAFRSIAVVQPHLLPEGNTRVVLSVDSSPVNLTDRQGDISAAQTILVGNTTEVFNCIDWRVVQPNDVPSGQGQVVAEYWNGSTWASLPYVFDSTTRVLNSEDVVRPLWQDGIIAWHENATRSAAGTQLWAQTSFNSITAYWIRLRYVTTAGVALALGDIEIISPGIRVGVTQAVRGLFPVYVGDSLKLVAAHDRTERRGMEAGAALSVWDFRRGSRMKSLDLVHREGAGQINQSAWPGWGGGASAGNFGTNGLLTSYNASVDLTDEPIMGAPYIVGITPAASPAPTTSVFTAAQLANTGISDFADQWVDLFLVCTQGNDGSTGAPYGEYRKIYASTTGASDGTVSVYDAFSVAPDADARFSIYRSPPVVRLAQPIRATNTQGSDDTPFRAYGTGAQTITLPDHSSIGSRPFDFHPNDYSDTVSVPIHWSLEWELRWHIRAAERWAGCFSPNGKRLLLTNGQSGVLAFDGARLREEDADTTSTLAGELTATLPDSPDALTSAEPDAIRSALLRSKPHPGRFIVDYQGRLVIAGFDDRPQDITYSYVGRKGNKIWPKPYRSSVRDGLNRPITGLATLYDRLVVFTEASIHEATVDEEGFLRMRPTAQGIGFMSHFAVVPVVVGAASALVGVTADGIALYGSGEPRMILPAWEDVIEGGVNTSALSRSVAAVWRQKNLAFFAIPAAGSSTNNRIVVLDYSNPERLVWWLWTAPFGISSMASVILPGGQEQILFGTDDGFVQTLRDAPTDDGLAVTGTARSITIQPGAQDLTPIRLNLTMLALGQTETVTVALYAAKRDVASATGAYPFGGGGASYNAALYNAATALYTDARYQTFRVNVPSGIKTSMLQIELSGAARWRFRSGHLEARALSTKVRT